MSRPIPYSLHRPDSTGFLATSCAVLGGVLLVLAFPLLREDSFLFAMSAVPMAAVAALLALGLSFALVSSQKGDRLVRNLSRTGHMKRFYSQVALGAVSATLATVVAAVTLYLPYENALALVRLMGAVAVGALVFGLAAAMVALRRAYLVVSNLNGDESPLE